MPSYNDYENRIRVLERRLNQLSLALASLTLTGNKALQDSGQTPDTGNGQVIFNCITTSAVTARSGTAMGSGTFNFVDSTGHTLATLAGAGTYTAYTDSSTGWASGKYGRVMWMNGHWEFITADSC